MFYPNALYPRIVFFKNVLRIEIMFAVFCTFRDKNADGGERGPVSVAVRGRVRAPQHGLPRLEGRAGRGGAGKE